MPKFVRNKRYKDTKGITFGKGVWIDDDGNIIKPGQGVYDKNSKTVKQYNSDGTISTYSRQDWALRKMQEHELKVYKNDRKYAIPSNEGNQITITLDKSSPTDKNRLATFPRNLLDSISTNAIRAHSSFDTGIGIAARESTFGNASSRKIGKDPFYSFYTLSSSTDLDNPYVKQAKEIKKTYKGVQSPTLLVSDWQQKLHHPFAPYFYSGITPLTEPRNEKYYDDNFEASLKAANNYKFPEVSPLQDIIELGVNRINPGDKTYPQKINAEILELQHSPEIRAYKKEHNLKAEGGSLWDNLTLQEKAEMMKVAIKNGITDLSTIRQKYNEFAEGGPLDGTYINELPPVTVTGYAPILLTTHYPVTSEEYPYTGHSELSIPVDEKTLADYQGDDYIQQDDSDNWLPYVNINKTSKSSDYNLVTNNCADATLSFLNSAFGTNERPNFFTTPGDVQDFAIDKLGGRVISDTKGKRVVAIPRDNTNYQTISEAALSLLETAPNGTVTKGYKMPDVVSGYYGDSRKKQKQNTLRNAAKKNVLYPSLKFPFRSTIEDAPSNNRFATGGDTDSDIWKKMAKYFSETSPVIGGAVYLNKSNNKE